MLGYTLAMVPIGVEAMEAWKAEARLIELALCSALFVSMLGILVALCYPS